MRDFWTNLKEYFLQSMEEGKYLYLPQYYETMLQNKSHFDLIEKQYNNDINWNFNYTEDPEGYCYAGDLLIYNNHLNYSFIIEFADEDCGWGWCECTPKDEGYNERHYCCGTSCDWTRPKLNIKQVTSLSLVDFNGLEKDLWELVDKWENDSDKLKQQRNQSRIDSINWQIENLIAERNELESIL